MNSLIIFPHELKESRAHISGPHLKYLTDLHDLQVNRSLPVGIWEGKRGHGFVEAIKDDEIIVNCRFDLEPLPRQKIILVVALPRPQTQKKIIHLASVLGIEELHFVMCERSEKSYLSAKSLEPENIKWEIVKGLEQAVDTIPPKVAIHSRFKPFVEDLLPSILSPIKNRVLYDTTIASGHAAVPNSIHKLPALLAFGPEAGWNDFEREQLKRHGLVSTSLGPRILRCETAIALALGGIIQNAVS